MQTEGSSKCMWTPLMGPADWTWNGVAQCGDACSSDLHRGNSSKGLHTSAGAFPQLQTIAMGIVHTYDVYIQYIILFRWIWKELPLLIHKLNMKLFQLLERFFCNQWRFPWMIFGDGFLLCLALLLTLCRITWGSGSTTNMGHVIYSNWYLNHLYVNWCFEVAVQTKLLIWQVWINQQSKFLSFWTHTHLDPL